MKKPILLLIPFIVLAIITGCSKAYNTALPSPIIPTQLPTLAPTPSPSPCNLSPIVVPTMPAEIPGYTLLDPNTNLHMTGTPQQIDLATYRLKVTGKVVHPLSLTFDEIRCMPKTTAKVVLICPGYFEDVATWSGVPIYYILDMAGVQPEGVNLSIKADDGHTAYIPIKDAREAENFLAYEWEGQPLPILHGFPVRAVFPSMYGNKWVKWLVEIVIE